MTRKKEPRALLYLEDVDVQRITETNGGWRVGLKLERETREGTTTRYYTAWFNQKPEFDVGWSVHVSGFDQVKPYIDGEGQPRAYHNLNGARCQAALPPGALDDPWANNEKGWDQ